MVTWGGGMGGLMQQLCYKAQLPQKETEPHTGAMPGRPNAGISGVTGWLVFIQTPPDNHPSLEGLQSEP